MNYFFLIFMVLNHLETVNSWMTTALTSVRYFIALRDLNETVKVAEKEWTQQRSSLQVNSVLYFQSGENNE